MKVVHVIPSMKIGGAQVFLTALLPALKERGVDVSLLVYNESHSRFEVGLMKAGVHVLSMGCGSKYGVRVIPTLHNVLAKADVAHVHLTPAIYQCAVASLDLKTPLVCTLHEQRSDMALMRPFRKWALSRYSAVVVPGETIAGELKKWLGEDSSDTSRIRVIPHGMDLERLRETRRAPGFGTDHRVITMIARFDDSKDQQTLLRAIPLLTDPEVAVVFIGEGPTLESHRHYARMLGVEHRVKFLGRRDDAPSLIAGSTIGVQSSLREVFPLSTLEFMGLGKPVVGSDIAGVRDIFGDSGLLFPPGDETVLAAQINHLLEDPAFYRKVSEGCLARSEELAIDMVADLYAELYSELSSESAGAGS